MSGGGGGAGRRRAAAGGGWLVPRFGQTLTLLGVRRRADQAPVGDQSPHGNLPIAARRRISEHASLAGAPPDRYLPSGAVRSDHTVRGTGLQAGPVYRTPAAAPD